VNFGWLVISFFLKLGNRHLNRAVPLQEFKEVARVPESCHRECAAKELAVLLERESLFKDETFMVVSPYRVFFSVAKAAQDSSL
jgi:hypothetical protein